MEVELVNLEGTVISKRICAGKDSYQFDLSDQPKGNYFVRISTKEGVITRKVVVE